jgi:hypothetical protein
LNTWRHDTQHNDILPIGNRHSNTQHESILYYDSIMTALRTQHDNTQYQHGLARLSMVSVVWVNVVWLNVVWLTVVAPATHTFKIKFTAKPKPWAY